MKQAGPRLLFGYSAVAVYPGPRARGLENGPLLFPFFQGCLSLISCTRNSGNKVRWVGHSPLMHSDSRPAEDTDPGRGMPGHMGHLTCALEPDRAVDSNCEC